MGSRIRFETVRCESSFLDPRKNFAPTVEIFEVRTDPLTGRTGHFSHFGAVRAQNLDLDSYRQPQVMGFCPFCTQNREKYTPRFLAAVVPEGQLTRNEAFLIPNLFPYDVHGSVLVMTDDHVVPLAGFSEGRLYDAFSLGMEFLRRTTSVEPSPAYHVMTWNYMPPSGGGLVHPHQQYFATDFPGNQFMDELVGSERFFGLHGVNFWSELVKEEEVTGERYLGRTGRAHWLTPFVSLGLLGDIVAIFPDVTCIRDFRESHISELVKGLGKVFAYFISAGIGSFNASLFFGPEDQNHFSSHFRIVPRTFLNLRDYASDFNFFQAMLGEPVSLVMPEDLCLALRNYFVT